MARSYDLSHSRTNLLPASQWREWMWWEEVNTNRENKLLNKQINDDEPLQSYKIKKKPPGK